MKKSHSSLLLGLLLTTLFFMPTTMNASVEEAKVEVAQSGVWVSFGPGYRRGYWGGRGYWGNPYWGGYNYRPWGYGYGYGWGPRWGYSRW